MSQIAGDRPAVHFTARRGWVNDPLALTWRNGVYHVFFQYVPGRTSWSLDCHWGHATSTDLLHWTEQPVALAPGDGDDGVWSGSIAAGAGGPSTLFYTSVRTSDSGIGRIRSAQPTDDTWTTWHKGPTLVEAPPGQALVAYRDPFVFRDAGVWRMLVGAGFDDRSAAALSYSSPDLVTWTYDGVATRRSGDLRDPIWTGTVWECPQVLQIDGSHVLFVSVWEDDVLHHVAYAVGHYEGGQFQPRTWRRLTYGPSYYAPSIFHDTAGRPGLIFWLRDITDPDGTRWAGALSIPHLLTLTDDELHAAPHPNLRRAWQRTRRLARLQTTQVPARSDLLWTAPPDARLTLHGPREDTLTLTRTTDGLSVAAAGHDPTLLPGRDEPVRVVLDGPIAEISTGPALFAFPIRHTTAATVTAGRCSVRCATAAADGQVPEPAARASTSIPARTPDDR